MNSTQQKQSDLQKHSWADFQSAVSDFFPENYVGAFGVDVAEAVTATLEAWHQDPQGFQKHFDTWKQSLEEIHIGFEASSDALDVLKQQIQTLNSVYREYYSNLIDLAPGLDDRYRQLLQFCLRQFMSAMEPDNWPLFNTDAIKRALDTGGESVRLGALNFEQDLKDGSTEPCLKRCADDAYLLGEDIAATEGEVVYQNELIQLIHYRPTCSKVSSTPMLIVPPCINKYYILDLTEELSVVSWLLSQGVDVYMISWLNPSKENAALAFSDYLASGVEAAMMFLTSERGNSKLHLAGYCIGGLLATLAAAKIDVSKNIASLTLLTTMLDYENPGELGVFVSKRILDVLSEQGEKNGCLSGNLLSHSFTLLKERQLLWPYVTSRYFLGEDLSADPIMYWNQDVTNLPAKMMEEYLKRFYVENELWVNDSLSLNDASYSINNIKAPVYLLACQKDHIVDWRHSLGAAPKFAGETRQVLASGGHVMGVLNSSTSGKGRYWLMEKMLADDYVEPDIELAIDGSWWQDWANWLTSIDDSLVRPDSWELEKTASIEPAPGTYVKQRVC